MKLILLINGQMPTIVNISKMNATFFSILFFYELLKCPAQLGTKIKSITSGSGPLNLFQADSIEEAGAIGGIVIGNVLTHLISILCVPTGSKLMKICPKLIFKILIRV